MVLDGWVFGDGEKRTIKIGRKTVHGKWGDFPDIPSYNWNEVDIVDADEFMDVCGMCEYKEIRYLHFMCHPEFTEFQGEPVKGIVAGRYCAPCMMSNGDAGDIKEKRAKVKKQEANLSRKNRRRLIKDKERLND